jgi:hypothetical protein
MTFQLSETAKQLIPKARIVSFAPWQNLHSAEIIQLFQAADDEGRYLTDADLARLRPDGPGHPQAARILRENAPEIVADARAQVLTQCPGICESGGELYPPARAEACWRDFWHFLRCITYGIAGGSTEFTSTEGLENMELLYQELRVPLGAMVLGLEHLKAAGLQRVEPQLRDRLAPYFDCLIEQMKRFQPQTSA